MAITAADVNKLRQMTGAGMMDCKKALTEADGNFDEAIVILRKKGQKVSASRQDRELSEGSVFIKMNDDQTSATILGMGCETDFVAKNEDFQSLGNAILEAAFNAGSSTKDEVLALEIDGRTAEGHMTDLMGKIGEKVEIIGFAKVSGEKIAHYRHFNGKIGVLVALQGVNGADVSEIGKEVAIQVATMKPVALDKADVDASVIEKEIEIGKDLARNEGKPEEMLEKIAQGRLTKFYKESTLLNQEFYGDNSKSVRQVLDEAQKGLTVSRFERVAL